MKREDLLTFVKNKIPTLNPDLLSLFQDNFSLNSNEIADLILKTKELKGSDGRRLEILGYLNGQEVKIPETFYQTLTQDGLEKSFSQLNCSLKIENVHLLIEKTRVFAAKFFQDFQIPISINMYVTPSPEAPCFKPHGDLTDVFIFQLLGTKKWSFYRDEKGQYISGKDDKSTISPDKLGIYERKEMLLKVDDILNIPPLIYHEACSTEGASVHLTISLNRLRVEHVIRIIESALLEELNVLKYENLTNDEFEIIFKEAVQKLDSANIKSQLALKKEQMMFLSRSQILLRGR